MKNILMILALAILWAVGGSFAGLGISAFFDVAWVVQCGTVNMMTGLLLLLLITRSEDARRLFYEGPKEDEPGSIIVGLLWVLPFTLLFAGIVWWLMAQFLK